MWLFLAPLVVGLACASASTFAGAYTRRFGERGGLALTALLRYGLGHAVWLAGYFWACLTRAPDMFARTALSDALGWALFVLGTIPIVAGALVLRRRALLPGPRDALAGDGIYAYVRHPIYAGTIALLAGVALSRPTASTAVASLVVAGWMLLQARVEEIDLVDRVPGYREYMREVPRFLPRLKLRR